MPRRMGRPGLMGTMARTAVVAGTATAVSGGMRRRSANRAAEDQQVAYAQQQQAAADQQQAAADQQAMIDQAAAQAAAQTAAQYQAQAAQSAPAGPDRMAKLRELGELHSAGVLSEDEFAAEKARILAS